MFCYRAACAIEGLGYTYFSFVSVLDLRSMSHLTFARKVGEVRRQECGGVVSPGHSQTISRLMRKRNHRALYRVGSQDVEINNYYVMQQLALWPIEHERDWRDRRCTSRIGWMQG